MPRPRRRPARTRSAPPGDPRAGLLGRLPLRVRLVAGFAAAMLLVLTGAGAFVYLRVRYALDLRLNEDLAARSAQLSDLARTGGLPSSAARGAPGEYYQILDAGNHVLATSPGLPSGSLLMPHQLDLALRKPVRGDRGTLLPISARPLRLYAVPLHPGATPPAGQPAVTVAAVRRDQRDEALRELVGQLALANLAALAIASLVGYRLARAALAPVERYRSEAARIAAGATGVRLAVPSASNDEVARLGRTLNDMLTALESALERERRFINDASHELRTPLTLLSTELELALRRPRTAPELEQTLRSAAADTADLIALADALLSVGVQPVQGETAPDIDLSTLLAGLVDRYRTNSGATAQTLRDQVEPGLTVRGDATRLGQVVTNLLDNATRYGAPPVTVTAARTGELVRLTVHDDGPGMSPQFLPHAAERFRRADTARTSPVPAWACPSSRPSSAPTGVNYGSAPPAHTTAPITDSTCPVPIRRTAPPSPCCYRRQRPSRTGPRQPGLRSRQRPPGTTPPLPPRLAPGVQHVDLRRPDLLPTIARFLRQEEGRGNDPPPKPPQHSDAAPTFCGPASATEPSK